MFSVQTLSQPPIHPTQEPAPLIWKNWKHDDREFKRESISSTSYDGDKVLLIGGYAGDDPKKLSLILIDPKKHRVQIIPSFGDAQFCSWGELAACYWKDSKVVVSGGYDYDKEVTTSTVAIVTLKDLDSENPSAHWEKIVTPTEFFRFRHTTYIYQEKMYVFGGSDNNGAKYDVWCLDLAEFTWSQCNFKGGFARNKTELRYLSGPGAERKFVFHENQVYVIEQGSLADLETIQEYDLETMSFKFHTIPKIQIDSSLGFDVFSQMIDRKIYFLGRADHRPKDHPLAPKFLTFDFDSQNWSEIQTESSPNSKTRVRIFSCNNLLLVSSLEKDIWMSGEFWSLPLSPLKPSKYSATSTTVNKVQQTMKEFFIEAPYSDVSFEVGSQVISAHKWLLIQKSKFFADLLSSKMSEEKASKIIITDLKAPTFRAFLEYLYSDHVEIDDTIALELLQQANKYFITGELKTACEKHILKNIEPENYVAFGKLAESIGATSLRNAVVLFIARNMKKIKERKDFKDISDALLRDSIVKFIVK